jgi:hypothetical protein
MNLIHQTQSSGSWPDECPVTSMFQFDECPMRVDEDEVWCAENIQRADFLG